LELLEPSHQGAPFGNYNGFGGGIEEFIPTPRARILPDNDLAGSRKAQRIIHTARYFELPTLLLDPIEIEPGLVVGGDIEQIVGLDADRFTRIIKQMLARTK
jgi:hypothetical protein